MRTTVTDFGPLLLGKVLGLNATQESSLGLIMHWADTQGLALLDLKDLQATIAYLVSDEGKPQLKGIGGLSAATAGVILREIVGLQAQGADAFFGEPAFDVSELLRTAPDGRGVISALELPAVQDRPALFSTFLMWLLAELFQELPEVGDPDKPRLVFFFDEAHLLFTGASADFLTQVTQTVRLIRSKGVGVFFVTQSPKDVPADVLGPAGQPRPARAAGVHSRRRQGAAGGGAHVPDLALRPRAAAPVARHRRGRRHRAVRARAPRRRSRGRGCAHRSRRWSRCRRPSSPRRSRRRRCRPGTRRPWTGSRPTSCSRRAPRRRRRRRRRAEEAERAADEAERKAKEARQSAPRRSSSRTSPLDSLLRSAGTQLGREITRSIFGTRRR